MSDVSRYFVVYDTTVSFDRASFEIQRLKPIENMLKTICKLFDHNRAVLYKTNSFPVILVTSYLSASIYTMVVG